MLKGLFSVLLVLGMCTEALSADLPAYELPASSSNAQVEKYKKLPCPQCGDWAIYDASETGDHGAKVKNIDGAAGDYLHVNKNTIVIPSCGTFKYTVKESKTEPSDESMGGSGYIYVISASLNKLKGDELCSEDDWTLNIRVHSWKYDNGGWGSFTMASARKGINPRSFDGWNIARTDPSAGDTSSMGVAIGFKVDHTKMELFQSASKLRPVYERMKVQPFDVERFSRKVETYCGQHYSGDNYNASVGNTIRWCEYLILTAKRKKFASVHCDSKSPSNQSCTLPSESLK